MKPLSKIKFEENYSETSKKDDNSELLEDAFRSGVDLPPKVEACVGKKHGDECSWINNSAGISYGTCRPIFLGSGLYCSDLNREKDGKADADA